MADSCAPILATPSHAFYTLRNAPVCHIPCLLLAFFDAEGPSPGAAFGTLNPSPSPVSSCICHVLYQSNSLPASVNTNCPLPVKLSSCICQHKLSFTSQTLFQHLSTQTVLYQSNSLPASVNTNCPLPVKLSSSICQHKLSFTSQTLFLHLSTQTVLYQSNSLPASVNTNCPLPVKLSSSICQHKLSITNQPLFLYLLRERGLNAGVHAECICLNTSKHVHEYLMHECTSFFLSVKSTHCTASQNVTQAASNNRLAEFLSHFAFLNTDLLQTPCPDL